jgi:hypothetical protein
MTYQIAIHAEQISTDVSQLAGRLGGICTKESKVIDGLELKFEFSLESMAQQFHVSVLHFPEVISVGRSPNPIQKAIAASRLCDCGWTTKSSCNVKCEAINE